MQYWLEPLFPLNFIYLLLNYLITFSIISFFSIKYNIKKKYFIMLVVTAVTPILLNGPLMEWTVLPDQSKYLSQTIKIRNLDFYNLDNRLSISLPSLVFAISPFIFIESFNSIGFINRTLLSLFIIYLIKKKINHLLIYYLILSPTILLYSSTALKDCIIIILSTFFFIGITKNKFLLLLIPAVMLNFIKVQNAYIMFLMYLSHIYIFSIKLPFKKVFSAIIVLNIFIFILVKEDFIIQKINMYFYNFCFEDALCVAGEKYKSYLDLLLSIPSRIFLFIISPFPEVNSIVKICIMIENVIVIYYLANIFSNFFTNRRKEFYFWFTSIFIFTLMYAITITNHGTISRYKITFIIPFLIILELIKKNKNE